jgi:hypothetical protein
MCQFRFVSESSQMLQLCRGCAEMGRPVIGTCRNVGSNLGSHLRYDSRSCNAIASVKMAHPIARSLERSRSAVARNIEQPQNFSKILPFDSVRFGIVILRPFQPIRLRSIISSGMPRALGCERIRTGRSLWNLRAGSARLFWRSA